MSQIILTQPHTHAGVAHAIGAELEVLLHDAEWLVTAGVARFKPGLQRRPREGALQAPETSGQPLPQPDPLSLTPARPEIPQ